MGVRNYLIEGVSCSGKTSACRELQRRGYQAFNGDTDLAYQGDPESGQPADGSSPGHHIWHVGKVEALVANQDEAVTFFCGGSRNFSKFVTLFDGVFVLEVDLDTLHRRLDSRVDEWGSKPAEREIVVRLHQTKEQIPSNGIVIDANAPLEQVVDEIVRQSEAAHRAVQVPIQHRPFALVSEGKPSSDQRQIYMQRHTDSGIPSASCGSR